jgi:Ni,Fe-hydrogenase III small subunit/formate hydrogenlyase subunit 6/NADH:ubiquinone oxidoreductase subunit I
MLDTIKARVNQGRQYIKNPLRAEINSRFRGFPILNKVKCRQCDACVNACSTGAIQNRPMHIDMGKCVFCGDCAKVCPEHGIIFSNFHKLAATEREKLKVDSNVDRHLYQLNAIKVRKEIKNIFGKSLKLRSVSAGGCNGCEMELNACLNVNFDMSRYGIEIVASPRHADGIVITGPVSVNMAYAVEDTLNAVPEPKIVIAMGTCAISGGIFHDSEAIDRKFFGKHSVDLYIPGCPVHPLTFIAGILRFIGKK